METIRNFLASVIAILIAYFHPVSNILLAVLAVLAVNFLLGLVTAKLAQNEKFSHKKAFSCFVEALVFFALIAFIFFVGDKIGNRLQALQCISGLTYALIYFYGVNIFKNLCRLMPGNKVLAFCYYVLSIEFIKHIPYLAQFLDSQARVAETDKKDDNERTTNT